MKLKKIAKYIDYTADVLIYINESSNSVWSGDMLDIHIALDLDNDKEAYLRECKEDGDYDGINRVKAVEKYLDYKLDGRESICATIYTNKHGVTLPQLHIYLKK